MITVPQNIAGLFASKSTTIYLRKSKNCIEIHAGNPEDYQAIFEWLDSLWRPVPVNQMGQEMPTAETALLAVCRCPECGGDVEEVGENSPAASRGHSVFCVKCDWIGNFAETETTQSKHSPPLLYTAIQSALAAESRELETVARIHGSYQITVGHLVVMLKSLALRIEKEMGQ